MSLMKRSAAWWRFLFHRKEPIAMGFRAHSWRRMPTDVILIVLITPLYGLTSVSDKEYPRLEAVSLYAIFMLRTTFGYGAVVLLSYFLFMLLFFISLPISSLTFSFVSIGRHIYFRWNCEDHYTHMSFFLTWWLVIAAKDALSFFTARFKAIRVRSLKGVHTQRKTVAWERWG